ncbi:dephospho-CoA kinase [Actinomyces faecalis]|uniref:dephospho-CoA kinase n=1 Tax=Actinomyces faecalis TaxID=2722820 RepID=UPI00155543BB|nr:dephospho-CoA kinase [Actinomyces faecalis]
MHDLTALVTGFQPFAGGADNASWQAVRILPDDIALAGGGLRLVREELPVTFAGAAERVRELIAQVNPDVIVHVGLDATAQAIKLETTAYNEATATIPDNAGAQPDHEAIVPGGSHVLHSSWAAHALAGRLVAAGLPVTTSDDAGRYVCNTTLYTALDATGTDQARPTGFVHVPLASCVDTPTVAHTLTALLTELADQVRRHRAWDAGQSRLIIPRSARPLRVGLTGGIGSGKSTVAGELAARGAHVVDADAVARAVVEPGQAGLDEIRQAFGETVLRPDGSLDRAALAARVFDDDEARARLEAIILPRVAFTAARQMEAADPGQVAVYDVPLLAEGGMADLFDAVVVVTALREPRLDRLEARGLSRADAEARMSRQASDEEREALADLVLRNDAGLGELRRQVDQLWGTLSGRD